MNYKEDTPNLRAREMVVSLQDLDAHEAPSEALRAEFKTFQRAEPKDLYLDPRLDDTSRPLSETGFLQKGSIPTSQIKDATTHLGIEEEGEVTDVPILYHPLLPGWPPLFCSFSTCI